MICIASDEYVPNQIIVNYKKQTNKKFPTKNFYSICGVIVITKLTPELPILDFNSRVFSFEKREPLFSILFKLPKLIFAFLKRM